MPQPETITVDVDSMNRPVTILNLTDRVFDRLTVTGYSHGTRTPGGRRLHYWHTRCACGKTKPIGHQPLLNGDTTSCGCVHREQLIARQKTHGKCRTHTYELWANMWQRCANPKASGYLHYGGKGVTVCDEWRSFERFLADMGECPQGMTIDRKENASGYSKDNCRWATPTEQQRNRTNNVLLTKDGTTMCVSAWAEHLKVRPGLLYARIRRGWDDDAVLTIRAE